MAGVECPKEWPERVVWVQSLVENGGKEIPNQYIRPVAERPTFDAVDHVAGGLNIPIIDLGGLHGNGEERERTLKMVSDACREWGFFQVNNHGVSLELVQKARRVWREFFYLPLDQKQVYANAPNTYEGYGSRIGVAKSPVLDWGDYFYLNLLPHSARNMEKWPVVPTSLREVVDEYGAELVKLSEILLGVISKSLGLDEGRFQRALGGKEMGTALRVNYYPKCPQPDLTLGLSSHSDPGVLTILLPDERVDGLQVRRGDAWLTVRSVPNSFIINVGDQIQILSNAVYKSVEHRVIVNANEERLSMAFFHSPSANSLVCPVPDLVTQDQPALYRPIKYCDYRLYMRTRGPRGKDQLASLKVDNLT